MQRFCHRAGVGIVAWRQAGSSDAATTVAPRDNHRRLVTRGRHGRAAVGLGVAGGSSSSMAATLDDATFAGSASVSPLAVLAITTDDATFAGSAITGDSVASMALTLDGAVFSGGASAGPLAGLAITLDDAAFAGSTAGAALAGMALVLGDAVFFGSAVGAIASTAAGAITRQTRLQEGTRNPRTQTGRPAR